MEEQEQKELALKLDCATRWNSILPMIERFIQLKCCIKQSLLDLGNPEKWKENNIQPLTEILGTLKPVELAVKELSKDESTILTSYIFI